MKLYINELQQGVPGKPMRRREIELPEHYLGVVLEFGGEEINLTEGAAGEASVDVNSPTGRLVVHPRVSNSITIEVR